MVFSNQQLIKLIITFLSYTASYGSYTLKNGQQGNRRNMLGGWSEGDIADERIQDCTLFAFKEVLLLENNEEYDFLGNVNESEYESKLVNVEQQVKYEEDIKNSF